MASVIDGFRWALLGTPWAIGVLPVVSLGVVLLVLVSGLVYFRRVEQTFADIV
jgi:lipopolysaccharide transport system permease protein